MLISLDGTWFFSSKKIHCDNCCKIKHKDGSTTYHHSVLTPVIVKPGFDKVIALSPEFILPQDGHDKQDCENAAAKRWKGKGHFDANVLWSVIAYNIRVMTNIMLAKLTLQSQ